MLGSPSAQGPDLGRAVRAGLRGGDSRHAARRDPEITRGDLGIIFKTEDEAALAACAHVWKSEPRAVEIEFCGVIYRDSEGIKAGLPVTYGRPTNCRRPVEPPGTEAKAGYHNHRVSSIFSIPDREYGAADPAYATPLARYLCAPNQQVLRMTPEGMVTVK